MFCANIYGLLDRGMVILQLCHFVADFIQLKLNFIFLKTKRSLFEPPFGGVRGNVHTPSIACWKGRG